MVCPGARAGAEVFLLRNDEFPPPPKIEVRFLHCVSHRVGLALWGLPNPAEPGRREGGVGLAAGRSGRGWLPLRGLAQPNWLPGGLCEVWLPGGVWEGHTV